MDWGDYLGGRIHHAMNWMDTEAPRTKAEATDVLIRSQLRRLHALIERAKVNPGTEIDIIILDRVSGLGHLAFHHTFKISQYAEISHRPGVQNDWRMAGVTRGWLLDKAIELPHEFYGDNTPNPLLEPVVISADHRLWTTVWPNFNGDELAVAVNDKTVMHIPQTEKDISSWHYHPDSRRTYMPANLERITSLLNQKIPD
jgi:hypothetical protein